MGSPCMCALGLCTCTRSVRLISYLLVSFDTEQSLHAKYALVFPSPLSTDVLHQVWELLLQLTQSMMNFTMRCVPRLKTKTVLPVRRE